MCVFAGNHINSQGIDEEPRNMAMNRPKSSKLFSRPKSAAVMERKPCATNTISISMKGKFTDFYCSLMI